MNPKQAFMLSLLITLLVASNIYLLSVFEKPTRKTALVARVIDGDTLVLESNQEIRLLNINAPEKKEHGYEEAKVFLAQLENTTIEIEELGAEKYGRTLARIFTPSYLNLEAVERGLAKKFLVHQQELDQFAVAEVEAISNERGMWKKSSYFNCLKVEINPEEERINIKSSCGEIKLKDWTIQDESRKKYKFGEISISEINLHTGEGIDNETDLFWNSKQGLWNNDRDTLYLYDAQGALAHHEAYGY